MAVGRFFFLKEKVEAVDFFFFFEGSNCGDVGRVIVEVVVVAVELLLTKNYYFSLL